MAFDVTSSQADLRPDSDGLVLALRRGDPSGATQFSATYRDMLVRFCWGYLGRMDDAEDAAQEICMKVVSVGEAIPDHFRPWVYQIARNHCLNLRRARARRPDHEWMTGVSRVCGSLTGNLTRLARDEVQSQLVELVRSLPEEMQEVLRLRYVEELSRPEIALVLEIPEALVKTRLFEGLRKLRAGAQDIGET